MSLRRFHNTQLHDTKQSRSITKQCLQEADIFQMAGTKNVRADSRSQFKAERLTQSLITIRVVGAQPSLYIGSASDILLRLTIHFNISLPLANRSCLFQSHTKTRPLTL